MAADLHYAPLPVPVIELVQKKISNVAAGHGADRSLASLGMTHCPAAPPS